MPCSTCGSNKVIKKTSTNKVAAPLIAQNLNNKIAMKDSDLKLAYVLDISQPLIGKATKINYGKRELYQRIYVHINDIDNVVFSLELPTVEVEEELIDEIKSIVVNSKKKKKVKEENDSEETL